MTQKVLVATLVRDYRLHPRSEVRDYHVREFMDALESGATLPAIIADKDSKRIVDGFHRAEAALRLWGDTAKFSVDFQTFTSEQEMYRAAVRAASIGALRLDRQEQIRAIYQAQELQITLAEIAADLSLTHERVNQLSVRMAESPEGKKLALKHPVRHLQGQTLTTKQVEGIEKAGGNPQIFYVNQVVSLIEHDLLDVANARLMERLQYLANLLDGLLATAA